MNGPYKIRIQGNKLEYCTKRDWEECSDPDFWLGIEWDKNHDGNDDTIFEYDLRTTLRLDRIEIPGARTRNYGLPSCFRYGVSRWRELSENEAIP